ncbi:PspC domain-containing protein [Bifidobacterium rousetti]|uniref:PspC domain-containing protein n=1 Tax=Bifidobacterium rousetti TaxID=2045439 RepID=UPI001CC28EBC|nr:PspC domain-containing protein [Bifidobacterium rousetti]
MNDNKNPKERFFSWIRSTGVMRGDDRWIGGVCSGLAVRLGWNPTLTRALLLASTLLFGFGAALYALAWALLPDSRDGRILAEDVIAGQWDWICIGVIVVFAVALIIPGAGWAAIVAAAVVLWAICQSSVRQQHGYGFGARSGGGRNGNNGPNGQAGTPGGWNGPYGGPNGGGPYGRPNGGPSGGPYNGPVGGNGANGGFGPQASGPASQGPNPNPFAGPTPGTQPQPGVYPNAANPPLWQGGATAGPVSGPAAAPAGARAPYAPVSGTPYGSRSSAPASPVVASTRPQTPPTPRRPRRKPAGPLIVLTVLGLILVSAAVVMIRTGAGMTRYGSVEEVLTQSTVWISGVCILLGLVLLALGAAGRRSGGLIPITVLAGITACAVVIANIGYGYVVNGISSSANTGKYAEVSLGGNHSSSNADDMIQLQDVHNSRNYWVSDASPETYDRLKKGVWFSGDYYFDSTANIDLSQFNRWYHADGDRNRYVDGCPAGQINLIVTNANVQVTLPDGCPYSFGRDRGMDSGASAIGGPGTVVRYGNAVMGIPGADWSQWDGAAYRYDWYSNGDVEDDVSFQINFLEGNAGKVTVKYVSDSTLPSYTDFVKSHVKNDDWGSIDGTTQHHYDVETGRSGPSTADKADKEASNE